MEVEIAKWVILSVMGFAVWFLKRTIDGYDHRIKDIEDKISTIQKDYLHRDDFKEFKQELRSMFDEIKADIRELKVK
jgi:sensor histidine kinase YesM